LLRCEEQYLLRIKDVHERWGLKPLHARGEAETTRYMPFQPGTLDRINQYSLRVGHPEDLHGALFCTLKNRKSGGLDAATTAYGLYAIVK
jgi:hypothetical protein